MGRFPEAEAEVRRAMQLDPLSPIVNMALAEVYTWERRYDDAIVEYKRIIALDPSFLGSYGNLSYVYEQKHMFQEAVSTEAQHCMLSGEPDFARTLQRAYAKSGYKAVLREELRRELQENARGRYTSPTAMAAMYSALGDQVRAFAWLEKGYEEHSSGMQFIAVDPEFDGIRSSPSYQYWLGVLNLPTSVNLRADAPKT
jgi:predicted Zn-dependent protease